MFVYNLWLFIVQDTVLLFFEKEGWVGRDCNR